MIREEQAAAWEERRDERRERRDNRMQEEIEALNEMLELSGSDSDTMNGLTAENDAIRGFWGQVRSGDLSWGRRVKPHACVAMKQMHRFANSWMKTNLWFTRTGEMNKSTVSVKRIKAAR